MIDIFAKWTIIVFGLFFICVGLLMLTKTEKANAILRKAGSTNFINYAEITIRIIPAVGLFYQQAIQNIQTYLKYLVGLCCLPL